MSKPLLILDVNGLICRKEKKNDDSMVDETTQVYIDFDFYKVYRRVGVDNFLIALFDKYRVGFWTSTTERNAGKIIDWIIPKSVKDQLHFIWFRDRTRLDPDYGVTDGIEHYDTVKTLTDIWQNPHINYKRTYNERNTLLVDDSVKKTRFNSEHNVLIVEPFGAAEVATEWIDEALLKISTKFQLMDITDFMTDMELS